MKKNLLLGMLMLATCVAVQANPITKSEARKVAQELVGIQDTTNDDVPVAPYYIFSRGAGQGFVIVSGDDATAPILGYTEQGDFDLEQLPEQLRLMLGAWGERLGQVQACKRMAAPGMRKARARAIAEYKKDWTDVPALVKTHWHQSSPYNDLAPIKEGKGRCMTGCVATAGSQVTYYFHKDNPNELQYDTPTYGYGTPITVSLPKGTPIEWDQMKLSGSGTARQNNAVATLMYALGTSAWLTYGDGDGTATSGHNYKMADAMNGQFNLTSAHWEKSGSTQQQWETKIYNNLKTKRPMLYSGVHPESGGHSVVLDGYQKSTGLFHFNFGWGGQGDGWYTVDDATGMNGFNSYQDLICDITPKNQNLSGTLQTTEVYHKAPTVVEVAVSNNGTLDYSGVYLYISKTPKLSSSPAALDANTQIAAGKTANLSLTLTNSSIKDSLYIFLCGKNKQVIDTFRVDVKNTAADLRLKGLSIDAGTESVQVDGYQFNMVNNLAARVTATLINGEEGTFCLPTFQCLLESYNQETKEWKRVTSQIMKNTTFDEMQTQDIDFDFTKLTEGQLYRAYLDKPAVASTQSSIQFETPDSVVYFTVREANLKVEKDGRMAVVTGRWNASLFRASTDENICSYDIAGLTDLSEQPVAPNVNAVFFASEQQTAWADYTNVVVGDVCKELVVQTDADFMPLRPFTANCASFVLTEASSNQWHGALLPFAAEIPYGMQVKQLAGLTSGNILEHTFTRTIGPMTVVTYLTDRDDLKTIVSKDVHVTTGGEVTQCDGLVRASTTATPLAEGSLVLGEYLYMPYYVQPTVGQTMLAAFHPVVEGSPATRLRTTSETLADGYYKSLAQTINKSYQTMAQYPRMTGSVLDGLKAELKVAEDLFTYRSHETDEDINNEDKKLKAALKAFEQGAIDGVTVPVIVSNSGKTEYFNLSGQRIDRPQRGLVIVRQNGKAKKIMLK